MLVVILNGKPRLYRSDEARFKVRSQKSGEPFVFPEKRFVGNKFVCLFIDKRGWAGGGIYRVINYSRGNQCYIEGVNLWDRLIVREEKRCVIGQAISRSYA